MYIPKQRKMMTSFIVRNFCKMLFPLLWWQFGTNELSDETKRGKNKKTVVLRSTFGAHFFCIPSDNCVGDRDNRTNRADQSDASHCPHATMRRGEWRRLERSQPSRRFTNFAELTRSFFSHGLPIFFHGSGFIAKHMIKVNANVNKTKHLNQCLIIALFTVLFISPYCYFYFWQYLLLFYSFIYKFVRLFICLP